MMFHVEPPLHPDCALNCIHRGKPDEKRRPKREGEHLAGRPYHQRPLDSERPFHNETEKTELDILLDKRTDFIKKLTSLTVNGPPIHIAQALLRDAAGSDANWHMGSVGIPSHVCQ